MLKHTEVIEIETDSAAPTLREEPLSENAAKHAATDDDPLEDVVRVGWESPDDPENPQNWSFKQKWAATAIVSAFTFVSPVSSSMIAPAMSQIADEFGITNTAVTAMTTSVFVLGYAFGPLFLGPMSEIFGRSHVLQISNMWYFCWNLGCGFAQNKGQLIAMRLMAGLGGSAPLALGGGVISDTWRLDERGMAIAIYSATPLLGPVIGPLAGAWVAEKSSWRWVFWATTIFDGIVQCLGLLFLKETYAPVLLSRKAARIRRVMDEDTEKGHKPTVVRTIFEGPNRHWKVIFRDALTLPFVFFTEPIIIAFGLFMSFVYGLLYLFLTTISATYTVVYHEKLGMSGLHYLALGIGITGASQTSSRFMDRIYIYLRNKNGGVGRPEFRLATMVPGTILLPIGLLITGWTTEAKTHWIGPDIGIMFVGAGIITIFQGTVSYIIDAFSLHAASALASVCFLRSIAGFGFPLFAPAMYSALGYGMGDTVLAIFAIVIGIPAPWFFWKYGERIRNCSRYAAKQAQHKT